MTMLCLINLGIRDICTTVPSAMSLGYLKHFNSPELEDYLPFIQQHFDFEDHNIIHGHFFVFIENLKGFTADYIVMG